MKSIIIIFMTTILLSSYSFSEETIYLTSLSWPPYAGEELEKQGASVAVATSAFKAMGYTLIVEFYPWSRAVHLASDPKSKYSGYFPEYYSKSIEENFVFSDRMGSGPLGFVENKANPISWDNLGDLRSYAIGTVQDYVNTEEFDNMAASGELDVNTSMTDTANIKKVGARRIDLAVIDANVLSYILSSDTTMNWVKDKVQLNPTLLEDKDLYVCFKKNAKGLNLSQVFNDGLKKIDIDSIMSTYLNTHLN